MSFVIFSCTIRRSLLFFLAACFGMTAFSPKALAQTVIPIAPGWARTKVNATIFRRDAVCSLGDRQVVSFYDSDGHLVLAERQFHSTEWRVSRTPLTGRVQDAHNGISMALDGAGLLHLAWDHHGHPLNYSRTSAADVLIPDPPLTMTGTLEQKVTYPEFYRLSNGDLLFFYRDGSSGNGNLVLNRYLARERRWQRLHDNLIDGEGQRNAYWQVAVDFNDVIHLSWTWRETGDVVTNHDICYAVSRDTGLTWQKTHGEACKVPITEADAEYAATIPQNSELANQTSMTTDASGRPVIANFWRDQPDAVPQYRLVWHNGSEWVTRQVGRRTTNFYRRGGGTKRPPVSRPLVLMNQASGSSMCCVLFRDIEFGGCIVAATTTDMLNGPWQFTKLTTESVGQADPMIDANAWKTKGEIHLLTQFVGQGDGEKEEDVQPQMVQLIEWTPPRSKD
ncbi:MAG: BNR repeat-containing protein [Planctomycetota bacterium]